MRNRYGRALYSVTAAVAATATLGLAATGATAANAATKPVKAAVTPSCTFNNYCDDPIFNVEFGIQYFQNNSELRYKTGNPVNLNWANDNNPGEDWVVDLQESVAKLYKLGYVSNAIQNLYKRSYAAEVQWVPYGVSSNLCRGLSKWAKPGLAVTLQPCGNFPYTLWIIGKNYKWSGYAGNTLITAASTNPSRPYVLTAGGGVWGGNPTANLQVDMQASDDGVINPGQLWCTASVDYYSSSGGSYTGSPTVKTDFGPGSGPSTGPSDPPGGYGGNGGGGNGGYGGNGGGGNGGYGGNGGGGNGGGGQGGDPGGNGGYGGNGGGHKKSVTPPTVGPPTYTANSPCFPSQSFNYGW
jgi:hypothetical protein